MAALVDEIYMRSTFQIHKDVGAGRITPYIFAASRRLKRWIGDALYATDDDELKAILILAEATLVMHFLQLNLNTNIRTKGLVATETVEGGVVTRYFNPTETAGFTQQYLEQAEELIREFLGIDAEQVIIVESEDACLDTGETWAEWQT